MFAASTVLALLASRLVFAESSYPQWPKDCSIVRINNDKSTPGIGCQCLKDGNYVSCAADFNTFLDNDQGILIPRRNGSASLTCSEFNLVGTYLGADCKGSAVALIDLGKVCKDNNGELQCGQDQSSTGSTAAASSTITSGRISTSMSSSPSGASDGSDSSQMFIPVQTSTSIPSPIPSPSMSVASTPSAMSTTSSAASIPMGSADSCGSYQKRMRIMDRSNET